jgi:hypothetical protein
MSIERLRFGVGQDKMRVHRFSNSFARINAAMTERLTAFLWLSDFAEAQGFKQRSEFR